MTSLFRLISIEVILNEFPKVKQKGLFREVMDLILFSDPNQITFYSELVHNTDGNELKCI